MASLKEHIVALMQTDWDYYAEVEYRKLSNPFNSRLSHKKFVTQYFKRAGKGSVLDFLNYVPDQKLNNDRIKHTNSIFFLGILIYKHTNLQNEFLDGLNSAEYHRFPFLWFLTCLFHDFGFTIEDNPNATQGIESLTDLKNEYGIDHCLLETSPQEINTTLFSVIESYFKYRLQIDRKLDHGIVAGMYFYDNLIKNRHIKAQQEQHNRFWGSELEQQYAAVSGAIAVHNIWLPDQKKKELYKEYHLDSLVDDFQPIRFLQFPLLYILGIVDTIDPMKLYQTDGFTPDQILKSIQLDFKANTIQFKNGANSLLCFTKLIEKTEQLKGWIDVDVEVSNNELRLQLRK